MIYDNEGRAVDWDDRPPGVDPVFWNKLKTNTLPSPPARRHRKAGHFSQRAARRGNLSRREKVAWQARRDAELPLAAIGFFAFIFIVVIIALLVVMA